MKLHTHDDMQQAAMILTPRVTELWTSQHHTRPSAMLLCINMCLASLKVVFCFCVLCANKCLHFLKKTIRHYHYMPPTVMWNWKSVTSVSLEADEEVRMLRTERTFMESFSHFPAIKIFIPCFL